MSKFLAPIAGNRFFHAALWTGLAVVLRLYFFNNYFVGGEPQEHIWRAILFSQGDLKSVIIWKPSLFSILIGSLFFITGSQSIAVAKIVPFFFSCLIVYAGTLFTYELSKNRQVRIFVPFFLTFSNLFIISSYELVYQSLYGSFTLLGLYFFMKHKNSSSKRHLNSAFLFGILALYSFILGHLFLLLLLMYIFSNRHRYKFFPYLLLYLAAMIVYPCDWLGFYYGMDYVKFITSIFSTTAVNPISSQFPLVQKDILQTLDIYATSFLKYSNYPDYIGGPLEQIRLVGGPLQKILVVVLTICLLYFGVQSRKKLKLFNLYLLLYLFILGFCKWDNPIYLIPILPILVLYYLEAVNLMFFSSRARVGILWVAFLLIMVPNIVSDVQAIAMHFSNPTHIRTGRFYNMGLHRSVAWFNEHVEDGATIRCIVFDMEHKIFLSKKLRFLDPPKLDSFRWEEEKNAFQKLTREQKVENYRDNILRGVDYLVVPSFQIYSSFFDGGREFRSFLEDGSFDAFMTIELLVEFQGKDPYITEVLGNDPSGNLNLRIYAISPKFRSDGISTQTRTKTSFHRMISATTSPQHSALL